MGGHEAVPKRPWSGPLARVRTAIEAPDQPGELEARRAAKLAEKDRYVKLYAQGHLDEEELETYLADLRVQIDNLRLLIESVEADIAPKREESELAATSEAWLVSGRPPAPIRGKNLPAVCKTLGCVVGCNRSCDVAYQSLRFCEVLPGRIYYQFVEPEFSYPEGDLR